MAAPPAGGIVARPFWETGWCWALIAAAALVPFLAPTVLPFNDLPNHVGRHAVFLEAGRSPFLRSFYAVHWFLAGNLGIDLIVRAIGPLFGAEAATRLTVAAIAPLTVVGIYRLARAIHGDVPPAALVAVALTYNWPLLTGFTNFCLAAAIALNVLASWIRLRGLGFALRFLIFAPLGFVTWVAHTAGWGLLGLGVFAYEVARALRSDERTRALLLAPFQTAPFAVMILFTLLWRAGTSTGAGIIWGDHFVAGKALAIASLFRERFVAWDLLCAALYLGLILYFLVKGGRRVALAGLALAAAYLCAFAICPQELFKSGFADRRLLTYGAMMLPLAIGVAPAARADPIRRRALSAGAWATLAFLAARMLVSAAVWEAASLANEARLAMLAQVPPQSRIFGLVIERCGSSWVRVGRPDHIQQLAIPRRESMINGMFQNPGLSQVEARFAASPNDPAAFDPNMLAVVHDRQCPVGYIRETLQSAMRRLPRDRFDYVWLIAEQPPGTYDTHGLRLVATRGDDRLYRVVR